MNSDFLSLQRVSGSPKNPCQPLGNAFQASSAVLIGHSAAKLVGGAVVGRVKDRHLMPLLLEKKRIHCCDMVRPHVCGVLDETCSSRRRTGNDAEQTMARIPVLRRPSESERTEARMGARSSRVSSSPDPELCLLIAARLRSLGTPPPLPLHLLERGLQLSLRLDHRHLGWEKARPLLVREGFDGLV